jgi:hypothetical protein
MPVISEEARATLKETFDLVAYRANRLKEWVSYQEKLQFLKNSFAFVMNDVRDGITPEGFGPNAVQRIRYSWNNCRQADLASLQLFHEEVQFIDKPLEAGTKVRYEAAKFLQLRDEIEKDIGGLSAISLKTHCSEFDTALTFQLIVLSTSVQGELTTLCDLTKALLKDFAKVGG